MLNNFYLKHFNESSFHFSVHLFQRWQSFDHHSSTPTGDRHTRPMTFCMKFNFAQLLFEQFFDIIDNFGSLQPKNESTFPFQYIIIFETYRSFEPLSSTPGGDRDVRPLTFLYEIRF